MASESEEQARCSVAGTAVVRRRPSVLVMKLPLKAAGATLDLGLARSRTQREAAAGWLRGLGADHVEIGEPHFADQAEMDQATRIRAVTAAARPRRPGADAPAADAARGVRVVLTATWDISRLSADEVLLLLDRLRFESAPPAPPAEPAEEQPAWTDPAEAVMRVMQQFTEPPAENLAPQFLFVTRLAADEVERATADALAAARRSADLVARAAGRRVVGLSSVIGHRAAVPDGRHDQMVERNRCAALLAGTTFVLREGDVVADDPRAVDVVVTLNATFTLGHPAPAE